MGGNSRISKALTPLVLEDLQEEHVFRQSISGLVVEMLPFIIVFGIATIVSSAVTIPPGAARSVVDTFLNIARILIVLEFFRRYFDHRFILSPERVIEEDGRFWFQYSSAQVRYCDIREVKIEQSIIGRILNYGTLRISTASTNNYEVSLRTVADPRTLTNEIRARRRYAREQMGKTDDL